MALRSSLLFLLAATSIATTNAAGKSYYRASVVGYEVLQDSTLTPRQNLMANVRNYEQFLKRAQEQALERFTSFIKNAYRNRQVCRAAYFDVEQAFDRTWHDGLLSKIRPHLDNNLQSLMAHYLNERSFVVTVQNEQFTVDIIVFPESGLLGSDYTIFLTVPDPALKIVPNASHDESLQMLSGYAKNYSLYLAANLNENYTDPSSNKSYKYNTNIVFDRNGAIIARYRKQNLYGEKPEHSYFKTDFNVTFGQFISFDILFKEPALTLITKYNVTHFIYPSDWSSELPFLTSVQTQWGWSVGNNVTLLSAGRANVARGSGGSGIFRGKKALNNLYSFTDNLGSTMIVGDVPIDGQNTVGSGKGDTTFTYYSGEGRLLLLQEPGINDYANANITLPTNQTSVDFKREICHETLCCNFDLTVEYVNPTSSVQYKAVVFDGKRTTEATVKEEFGLQLCGVVLCSNESISSCGPPAVNGVLPHYDTPIPRITFTRISITGNFINQDANPLPNVLLWPSSVTVPKDPGSFLINPNEVTFAGDKKQTSLIVNGQHQVITVAIHSRVFSRDPGNGAYLSSVSMLAMVASMSPLFMWYV